MVQRVQGGSWQRQLKRLLLLLRAGGAARPSRRATRANLTNGLTPDEKRALARGGGRTSLRSVSFDLFWLGRFRVFLSVGPQRGTRARTRGLARRRDVVLGKKYVNTTTCEQRLMPL